MKYFIVGKSTKSYFTPLMMLYKDMRFKCEEWFINMLSSSKPSVLLTVED